MPKSRTIGVILPTYNEAATIGAVLDELPQTITAGGKTYATVIIVVNDGSADDTAKIAGQRPHVHVINHLLNLGAGGATRTGLVYALQSGCDFAVTMDADGQHAVGDVVKLAKAIVSDEGDFIIGSRLINTEGMPWNRVMGNKTLSLLTFLLFGVFVTDSQSGLKALNRQALEKITFYSNNFAFCSEMIWKAKKQRLRIKEIPIKPIYTSYSLSKGQQNLDAIHIISQLFKRRILELLNG